MDQTEYDSLYAIVDLLPNEVVHALAHTIAEYEVMRDRLIELEEIYPDHPTRWRVNGEKIVDLDEAMHRHFKIKERK